MIALENTKICRTCRQEKSIEDFYRYKDTLDKRFSECKICCLEKQKIYNKNHKQEDRVYQKIWRHNNPNKAKAQDARDDARKYNAEGSFTGQEWIDLCSKYNHTCLRCLKKKKLTHDHIVPLSKGGSDYISNIQPLCLSCNCIKHTKIIDYRFEEKDEY